MQLRVLKSLISIGTRRELSGPLNHALHAASAALAVWVIYSAVFAIIDVWVLTAIFICALYGILFLTIAPTPTSRLDRIPLIDWWFSLSSLAAGIYFAATADDIVLRMVGLDRLTTAQLVFGSIVFINTLEATRRTTGLGLTAIVLLFVAYNLLGHRFEGYLGHNYIDYSYFLDITVFTTEGIIGLPARVVASYAFLFVMFGTLLSQSGGGDFFFNISAAMTGKRVGGPAKVAVVSSGMYGMISGSPTSDVVTTGSITIPMMRRLGYSRTFAGAVETAASAGGSLIPPVMGSAVFIMAEYTGIEYRDIAIAAILPGILYYFSIYMQVHFRSKRIGLAALEDVPPVASTLRQGWIFLIPLIVLTTALLMAYSPSLVAVVGSSSLLAIVQFVPRYRMSLSDLVDVLAKTTMRIVPVAGACAAAGLVIGGVNMTGLAGKLSSLILFIADGALFPTLVVTAAVTIILGFGMPSASAYILSAVLVSSVLTDLSVPLLVAHMFILYFAIMSSITPPIAVAAYAAASIAEGNPLRIASLAVRLALAAFVVPFAFIYGHEILLIGSPLGIAMHFVTAAFGFLLLAIAIEGFYNRELGVPVRLLLLASGLLFVVPSVYGVIVGLFTLGGAVGLAQMLGRCDLLP